MSCRGCDGKGWVDSRHVGPCICPLCKGTGKYDEITTKKTTWDVTDPFIWGTGTADIPYIHYQVICKGEE